MNHKCLLVVNRSLQVDNSSLNQTELEKQHNKNKINISNRGMQRQHLKNTNVHSSNMQINVHSSNMQINVHSYQILKIKASIVDEGTWK
jgi:hypothetical protein